MPCIHKFHDDLHLDNLDFEPTTLIVGTFNPSWPEPNPALWFYGRTRKNYFWDVLPRILNGENLRNATVNEWKPFCSQHYIALTDMLTSIDDAEEDNEEHRDILRTYLDAAVADYFEHFTFTDIIGLLEHNQTITKVFFTRQPGIPLFDGQWNLIVQYCQANELRCANLLTPSAMARFQIGAYRLEHPDDPTPLRNFIFREWNNVINAQPNQG
jgi:hypothetical protein